MLLSGRAPFNIEREGRNKMLYRIRSGDFVFRDEHWGHVGMKARKLVLSMMQMDPKARVSAEEALRSEWMLSKDEELRRSSLEKSLKEIVCFQARRKLKGAIGAVMYAVGGAFWNIETTAIWRENLHGSDSAVNGDVPQSSALMRGKKREDGFDSPYPSTPPTFEQLYRIDAKLRVGKHATIWRGTSTETDDTYAIKIVDRKNLSPADEASVLNEVAILKCLRHRHILPLLDFFEEPVRFLLVIPFVKAIAAIATLTGFLTYLANRKNFTSS